MSQANNLRRCHSTFDQDTSLIAVVEMSQSSWLVAGIVPGISRQPANKIKPDQTVLLGLLRRWQGEVAKVGREISRLAVAFEAGRDGFWLARWLQARDIYMQRPSGQFAVTGSSATLTVIRGSGESESR